MIRVNLPTATVARLEVVFRTTAEVKLRHRVQNRYVGRYGRMPCLAPNAWRADLPTRMPVVLYRWSANSAYVQLARSSPCLAGPSITHRRRTGARSGVSLGVAPLAWRARSQGRRGRGRS